MSVRFRITLVTALFLAGTMLVLSIFAVRSQTSNLNREAIRRGRMALLMLSEMTTPALGEGDVLALARMADNAVRGQLHQVMVADRWGSVLTDSEHRHYGQTNDLIVKVIKERRPTIRRQGDFWVGGSPVHDRNGERIGVVYIAYSTRSIDAALANTRRTVAIIALLAALVGVLVAYGIGRYISGSLVPLLSSIRTTATGSFDSRVQPTGMVELDEIGQAFNRMNELIGREMQVLATLNRLTAGLMAAETMPQFQGALRSACSSLVGGEAMLMTGDPHSGVVGLESEEAHTKRVGQESAAFIAADEVRAIRVGRDCELPPGYAIAQGITIQSGIVAPLVTPSREIVGVMAAVFEPDQKPSPDAQDEAAVLAVAALVAPIMAALERNWTQERTLEALRQMLLPEALPQPEGLEVFATSEPTETPSGFGGDYYDILQLGEHEWGFAIGDVTGHGLDAGRYTAMAKYVVRSFVLEYHSPAKTIAQADKVLASQMSEMHFVTIFLATLDAQTRELVYTCGGHPAGLWYSRVNKSFQELRTGGGLIGYGLTDSFDEERIQLEPGDMLVLCTDGILEATRNGEEYGMERVKNIVSAYADRSLDDIAAAVMDNVRAFAHNLVRDDMALLLVRVAE